MLDGSIRACPEAYHHCSKNSLKAPLTSDCSPCVGRKQLAELLRFPSSKSGDDLISLQQYTDRAKEGQKSVYYIAADSLAAAASAPFVEQLIKKDLEVSTWLPPGLLASRAHPAGWRQAPI